MHPLRLLLKYGNFSPRTTSLNRVFRRSRTYAATTNIFRLQSIGRFPLPQCMPDCRFLSTTQARDVASLAGIKYQPSLAEDYNETNNSTTIDIQCTDGSTLPKVPLIWLRDCCQCDICYNQQTHQRNDSGPTPSRPAIDAVTTSSSSPKNVDILWRDGHRSTYDTNFLRNHYNTFSGGPKLARKLWTRHKLESISHLPTAFSVASLDSRAGIREILHSFLLYGFALIDGVQPTEAATQRAVLAMACKPFDSIYGAMWTFTSDATRSDMAYSSVGIAPHTDMTYYQTPPRIMTLHCIERDATTRGGQSVFVDGFEIARQLQQSNAEAYEALCRIPQEYRCVERSTEKHHYHHQLSCIATVFSGRCMQNEVCLPQDLLRVRFNMYDRGFANATGGNAEQLERLLWALHEYRRLALSEDNQWRRVLTPGTLALFDNWRVLHARTGFEGRRVLTGCYVAEEDFSSALSKFSV